MTDIESLLPNPFLSTQADILLAALERRLSDDRPLFLEPEFMARLESAIIAAGDTPLRETKSRRLVARLRELGQ